MRFGAGHATGGFECEAVREKTYRKKVAKYSFAKISQQPEIALISHWFGHRFHFMECVLPYFLKRGYVVYYVKGNSHEAERFLQG
jgi:hypothetical protein